MKSIEKTRIEFFFHEYQTWERTLDFFKTENAYLKTRLSSFLDADKKGSFLLHAENFQTQFLEIDEHIKNLKHNINEIEKFATEKKYSEDKKVIAIVKDRHQRIRIAIEKLEINFLTLKNNFIRYTVELP